MKRLIFINLLIDRFWGQGLILDRIFNISNPESLRLSLISINLAINYQDKKSDIKNDFYILSQKPDDYWVKQFSTFHQLDKMNYQIIHSDPYAVANWIEEFELKMSGRQFHDFVFSGFSSLEVELLRQKLKIAFDEAIETRHKMMNAKQFLLKIAVAKAIPVPESRVFYGNKIDFQDPDFKDKIFKFDHSSGGAGQFNLEKLKVISDWAKVRGLQQYWDSSVWISQKKLSLKQEWSVFSHTESDEFYIAKVKYDSHFLSNRHYFEVASPLKVLSEDIYLKIKKSIQENNYHGYFGFDVVCDEADRLFVVDLNLRLTKTHLLQMALKKWKLENQVGVFYRKRFLFNSRIDFQEFWTGFCSFLKVDEFGSGIGYRVLPFDVFGFSQGQSEITFFLDCESEAMADSLTLKIDEYIKGVG